MKKKACLLLGLILVLTVCVVPNVSAWLGDWRYRFPLTVNCANIDGNLTNYPVYVNLTEPNVFSLINENYLQISITDASSNQLYVEVASWNATLQNAELWTSANLSSVENTTLYFYFDNNQLPNSDYVGLTGSTPALNVWNQNFKFASHFNDNPDSSHIKDSTSNVNDGTKKGADEPVQTEGQINKAQSFDGIDDKVTISNDASLNIYSQDWTMLFWTSRTADKGHIFYYATGAGSGYVRITATTNGYVELYLWDGADVKYYAKTVTESMEMLALTHTASTKTLQWFLNGAPAASTTHTLTLANINPQGAITLADNQLGSNYMEGVIDEFWICNDTCTNDFIKTSYYSQTNNLITEGTIETYSAPTPTPPDVTNDDLLGLIVAFFVVAIAVAAALVLTTRKR